MKKTITLLLGLMMFFGAVAQKNIYDFKVKDQNGKTVNLSQYRGKYILIVNTATQCGFTPQYTEMENMYTKFKDDGFVILDFPCNQFGEQAPGNNREIHAFCTENYRISFPQFDKVEVNGPNADPLFTWLKSQKGFEGFDTESKIGKILNEMYLKQDPNYAQSADIKWNFTKFLIDRNGNVVKRFEPTVEMHNVINEVYEIMYTK